MAKKKIKQITWRGKRVRLEFFTPTTVLVNKKISRALASEIFVVHSKVKRIEALNGYYARSKRK